MFTYNKRWYTSYTIASYRMYPFKCINQFTTQTFLFLINSNVWARRDERAYALTLFSMQIKRQFRRWRMLTSDGVCVGQWLDGFFDSRFTFFSSSPLLCVNQQRRHGRIMQQVKKDPFFFYLVVFGSRSKDGHHRSSSLLVSFISEMEIILHVTCRQPGRQKKKKRNL